MITLGPSRDLRVEATVNLLVRGDGATKLVGTNPPAYDKLFSSSATGVGTVDIVLTTDATHEAFVKLFKVTNVTGAAGVFTIYRDGALAAHRWSLTYNVPDQCEFIWDDTRYGVFNVNAEQVIT